MNWSLWINISCWLWLDWFMFLFGDSNKFMVFIRWQGCSSSTALTNKDFFGGYIFIEELAFRNHLIYSSLQAGIASWELYVEPLSCSNSNVLKCHGFLTGLFSISRNTNFDWDIFIRQDYQKNYFGGITTHNINLVWTVV